MLLKIIGVVERLDALTRQFAQGCIPAHRVDDGWRHMLRNHGRQFGHEAAAPGIVGAGAAPRLQRRSIHIAAKAKIENTASVRAQFATLDGGEPVAGGRQVHKGNDGEVAIQRRHEFVGRFDHNRPRAGRADHIHEPRHEIEIRFQHDDGGCIRCLILHSRILDCIASLRAISA
ncbi:MAG: hypothetical protein IPK16_29995 [Anaerolineales bacterium]|nr:hypothetical protein [Anaerolineales bacterium]